MTSLLFSRIFDTIAAAVLSVFAYFEAVHSVSICIIIGMVFLVLFNLDGYVT